MGEGKKQALRVSFDGRLKLEFHGATITSDAGLLVYRELDEALELTTRSGGLLDDWRTGKNTQLGSNPRKAASKVINCDSGRRKNIANP